MASLEQKLTALKMLLVRQLSGAVRNLPQSCPTILPRLGIKIFKKTKKKLIFNGEKVCDRTDFSPISYGNLLILLGDFNRYC